MLKKLFEKIDEISGIKEKRKLILWLERLIFVFLVLMTISAPHSIAATQTAWLIGMLLWLIRIYLKPLKQFQRTPLDFALWLFVDLTIISSLFSYAPDISFGKLNAVFLFLIFYFVFNNIRSAKQAKFLVSALIFSCMFNVLWMPIERIFGRGVEIIGVSQESCLTKALLINGDTLLKANGKKLSKPEDLVAEIEKNPTTKIDFYRPDFYFSVVVKRDDLLPGETALAKLGIESWKHSRNWRSAGFYGGAYMTYSEVLQLIASLALGLFVALPKKRGKIGYLLIFVIVAMSFAMLLTITRASQIGFVLSAFAIVLCSANRKALLVLAVAIVPICLLAVFAVQQARNVGFFDQKDDSTKTREKLWTNGFNLLVSEPRHMIVGVGMDSIKRMWKEWNLFDSEKDLLHFHSTPLQIAVERGLPTLFAWILFVFIYARWLWKSARNETEDWQMKGILLGAFGGLIGFLASGMVHYNLGDSEVAMVFFWIAGVALKGKIAQSS